MTGRLRVGITRAMAGLGGPSGHGRVWEQVLRHLQTRVDLTTTGPVDVHLVGGHDPLPALTAPVVGVIHDVRWADATQRDALPVTFLDRIVPATAATVAVATRLVVPARAVREQVVAEYGIPAARVAVVPDGVDTRIFRPRAHLPGGTPYVAFVGAAEPRKRLDVLRDAMTTLADRGLPHRLVLRVAAAPWTESRALLAAATAELPGHPGRVVVLPRLDDRELAWMLAGADALCLPSECEGFGLPVLEAMACGTPVVVADRGALPEVVGDAGVLAEPTADAIGAALVSVLTDPARAADLAGRGRARAATMSWEATADGIAAVLREAADAGDRPAAVPEPATVAAPPWVPVRPVDRCPGCGAGRVAARPVAASPDLATCTRCGCVWADRALDPARFDESRPRRMPAEWPGVPLDPAADADRRARAAADRLHALEGLVAAPGRLLVIALDPEPLAAAATARGWAVTTTRSLTDLPEADDQFDAVAALHCLGTATDVVGALHALAARTAPGGGLLVEVANWDAAARRRDGRDWHDRRPLESIAFFDRDALRGALTRAGWTPARVDVRTRPVTDVTAATHALPPFRRALRRIPARAGTVTTRVLQRAYDRVGWGGTVVATARRPVTPAAAAPPRGSDARG